jgi:topoisomerase-4 subunit B
MYIGGTDDRAMHHLAAEVIDNAMDEAVAGHANRIEIELLEDGSLSVRDNGRGIPVDPHPKFKNKSALEVILTTLHSGGKFSDKVYQTSGGLHGVGVSVVNALSAHLVVDVARDKALWRQEYERGVPKSKLLKVKAAPNKRGTGITFRPDPDIFGAELKFQPARLHRMARSKAYLFRGVEIRWSCAENFIAGTDIPAKESFHFPGGLTDFLKIEMADRPLVVPAIFAGEAKAAKGEAGRTEWAICWPVDEDGLTNTYCNTVPTPMGGSHESGLRTALTKSLKAFGELTNNKKASQITSDDICSGAAIMLSVFVTDPQFQGQTKEKLSMSEAARMVEAHIKDHFDHWLSGDRETATVLLEWALERADERLKRRQSKELKRQSATRKARLPGKLADCTQTTAEGTELFLVEGDSAGGSAKQARNRKTQAILPLRGKILNVASAAAEKIHANQELKDLIQAMGCGVGKDYNEDKLRYERIIIMTDADVDGAHIASLLMTFFYRQIPGLIADGHLFLAVPPLYRLNQGAKSAYAVDDAHKDALMESEFSGRGKVEISRFKGLGEMPPAQLKETTMDPARRQLEQITMPDPFSKDEETEARETAKIVEHLMGRKPEARFAFIQEHAKEVETLDI